MIISKNFHCLFKYAGEFVGIYEEAVGRERALFEAGGQTGLSRAGKARIDIKRGISLNFRQKKKVRKKLYKQLIEDVALEISLDTYWRKRILEQLPDIKIDISYQRPAEIPKYIQNDIVFYRLEFWVMRVNSCLEYFDEGLVIFKFQSKEYPEIVRFSGNNPSIL